MTPGSGGENRHRRRYRVVSSRHCHDMRTHMFRPSLQLILFRRVRSVLQHGERHRRPACFPPHHLWDTMPADQDRAARACLTPPRVPGASCRCRAQCYSPDAVHRTDGGGDGHVCCRSVLRAPDMRQSRVPAPGDDVSAAEQALEGRVPRSQKRSSENAGGGRQRTPFRKILVRRGTDDDQPPHRQEHGMFG